MPERAWVEEHLLIRDREMKERIQIEEPPEHGQQLLGDRVPELLHRPRIDDRRGEEPQRQHVREQIADIAKVHGQGRQHETEARGEHELNQHDHRKPRQIAEIRRVSERGQETGQDREPQEKVHHVREHAHDWQHFGGKQHFLD